LLRELQAMLQQRSDEAHSRRGPLDRLFALKRDLGKVLFAKDGSSLRKLADDSPMVVLFCGGGDGHDHALLSEKNVLAQDDALLLHAFKAAARNAKGEGSTARFVEFHCNSPDGADVDAACASYGARGPYPEVVFARVSPQAGPAPKMLLRALAKARFSVDQGGSPTASAVAAVTANSLPHVKLLDRYKVRKHALELLAFVQLQESGKGTWDNVNEEDLGVIQRVIQRDEL
jgi:hypothetical protein